MDGYWKSTASLSSPSNENWDDYSHWIQLDTYFESNIQVNSNGEDWNDYSYWTQQDQYFESNATIPCTESIQNNSTDIGDYSYWLLRDNYFNRKDWPSFDSENWDDFSVETTFDNGDQDEWSTWIQPGMESSIVVDGWQDYSYWLHRDDYFNLKNWPAFDDDNWDSECDDGSRRDDESKISSIRGSQTVEAAHDDVSSESGFSMTDSDEGIGSSDGEERLQKSVFEPCVGGKQLIGDDFFMQIARWKYFKKSAPEGLNAHGTVRSGLCIAEATQRFNNIKSMSEKLVICLGAVDVVSGRTADTMIADMRLLLEQLKNKFGYATKNVTLCTIPPLPNLEDVTAGAFADPYMEKECFNNWIISLKDEGYEIISFDEIFTKDGWEVKHNLYKRYYNLFLALII